MLVGGTTAGLVDELASLGATLPLMALLTGVSTFVLLFLAFGSVVSATIRLLGRANWWAPRPLRRLYARYGIKEEIEAERAGVPV